jgi:hypothetical protein
VKIFLRKSFYPRKNALPATKRGHGYAQLVKLCHHMSVSPLFRKAALCSIASAFSLLAFGQGGYIGSGAENAIAGALAGDQVHPGLSINTSGGFLVFEDSFVENNGMTIRAIALDGTLSRVGQPFRVSVRGPGTQEHPQVALLLGGGAAFVWQGGKPGFQHIYARFLSSSNTWINGAIQADSFGRAHVNPSVAVLTNGNVIVIWASFNQASPSSMQDVYGQLFSPTGDKIGGEIAINQMTLFNQRAPQVTALADGGFVVVWISEQERSALPQSYSGVITVTNRLTGVLVPSVDVKMRIFDLNASPSASHPNEVFVNTASDPCASPSVASLPGGGVGVVWSQKDISNRSNSWDIVFSSFSAGSYLASPTRYVNTDLYGDQYAPVIGAADTNYLVTWTSLGQDGFREGVYGRLLASDGSATQDEFRLNDTVINSQMHPTIGSDAAGRFLAAWTGYTGTAGSFDLFSKTYTAPGYSSPGATNSYAAPVTDPFLNNTIASAPPTLNTPTPPVATDTNPVVIATYSGLFYETNGINVPSAGAMTMAVGKGGLFTARIISGGKTWSTTGRFGSSGDALARVARGNSRSLNLFLHQGNGLISGTITDGQWSANLLAYANGYSKTNSAPQAGSFMLDVPGAAFSALSPGGDSYGPIKIDSLGNVQWVGSLADGSKFTQKSAISAQGLWPVYVSLYGGQGLVMGWVQLTNSSVAGQLVWIKPSGMAGKYYPAGFTNEITVSGVSLGSLKSSQGGSVKLTSGNRNLMFLGGGLSSGLSVPIHIDTNGRVTSLGTTKVNLTISSTTGLFRGAVVDPRTGKNLQFQGAIYDDWDVGLGYFLNPAQSGQALIAPMP